MRVAKNDGLMEFRSLWEPDESYEYPRNIFRYLRVTHKEEDVWDIQVSDSEEQLTIYPAKNVTYLVQEPGRVRFRLQQAGHFVVIQGKLRILYLFLDDKEETLPPSAENAADFDILPNQHTVLTDKINQAMSRMSERGGGILYFPPGLYRTGMLRMCSNTYLYLTEGAQLLASENIDDFPLSPEKEFPGGLPESVIPKSRRRMVYFDHVHNSGILGRGTLDGDGSRFRRDHRRPRSMIQLIRAVGCQNLRFEDIILQDSEFWCVHFLLCRHVLCQRVKICNEVPPKAWDSGWKPGSRSVWNNADGFNPDSSQNVTIRNCFLHTGDDCIPIKNTGCYYDKLEDVTDIHVDNCLMVSPVTALKIGTETRGGSFSRISFQNCQIVSTSRVIGLDLKDGATITDVTFRDIEVRNCNRPFDIWITDRDNAGVPGSGSIHGITIDRLRIEKYAIEKEGYQSHIFGNASTSTVENVYFNDFTLAGELVKGGEELPVEVNHYAKRIFWNSDKSDCS